MYFSYDFCGISYVEKNQDAWNMGRYNYWLKKEGKEISMACERLTAVLVELGVISRNSCFQTMFGRAM